MAINFGVEHSIYDDAFEQLRKDRELTSHWEKVNASMKSAAENSKETIENQRVGQELRNRPFTL